MEQASPRVVHIKPWILGVGFFMTASVTVGLTRFDGGVSILWIATALLLGWLATTPCDLHRRGIAACCLASLAVTAFVGLGPLAAPFLIPANVGEAVIGAWLLRRWLGHTRYFESVSGIVAFVIVAGVMAPALGAIPGALMIRIVTGHPFQRSYSYWMLGHGLGTVTFTPLVMLVLRGELRSWVLGKDRRMTEALLLILAVTLITAVVFNQSNPLLLCLPMLPTMFATIRLGRFGAASSIVIMTVIGGGMTMLGHGPIHSTADDAVSRAQFLQLYLATAVLLVLPVAALLRQHRDLVTRVSESEARYRLIERHSTDAVLNAGIDGDIHYASSAFSTLGGFDPEAMIGRNALELVQECDRPAVARAHHEALRTPDRAVSVEYRVMVASGEMRWFESNTRAVIAETGLPIGVVSAIRDVSHRKAAEHKLRQAADTDALTGLPNRRAFIDLLDTGWQRVRGGEGECAVAIFDIDSFKAVNDVHGHAVGDLALNAFANVARRTLRGADVIARIGGEEFAVLFWNAELVTAAAAAERLRCAVAKEVIQTGAGARFSMTVSVGLAALSAAATPAEALEAADEALYAAKHAGRNCLRLVC